jgi:hypothetical protein
VEGVKVVDLLRLLAASDEGSEHLKKLFEWQIERAMTAVRAVTAAIGAVFVALLAALLDEGHLSGGLLALVGVAIVFGLAYAWSRYERARDLENEYVIALGVLRELAPLTPLIRLWPDVYID